MEPKLRPEEPILEARLGPQTASPVCRKTVRILRSRAPGIAIAKTISKARHSLQKPTTKKTVGRKSFENRGRRTENQSSIVRHA